MLGTGVKTVAFFGGQLFVDLALLTSGYAEKRTHILSFNSDRLFQTLSLLRVIGGHIAAS